LPLLGKIKQSFRKRTLRGKFVRWSCCDFDAWFFEHQTDTTKIPTFLIAERE
jgi:hypothetical protein